MSGGGEAGAPVLGVERSFAGKRWRTRAADDRAALTLAQRLALPEVVGRLLAARDVSLEDAEAFLDPTLRHFLPDPSSLRDMDQAAERLADAVVGGEAVAVFGDYDVDGATSSALLSRFFAAVGARLRIYIPDRIEEGYGPNAPAMLRLAAEGVTVVVTVDCGIAAHDALAAAAEAGVEVIVVDHHAAEPKLPPARAVVNPNRLDEGGSLSYLAAVGVTYLLVVAVNRRLRALGWYRERPEPDLLQWLDLVALGTVCDAVPLVGLNRALVAQGLKVMGRRRNVGLMTLADVAGVNEAPTAYHAGFVLGPRVNAGGRVGQADLGARLLTTDDAAAALALAERLDAYNRERQAIEAGVLEDAIAQVETTGIAERPVLLVAGANWHPGVIGIVASRLSERFNRPACVVAVEDGVGKGSARSLPGVDIGNAVIAARQAGLLTGGGGHPMAAGFTLDMAKREVLEAFFEERLGAGVSQAVKSPSLGIDAVLTVEAAGRDLLGAVERLGPFGVGNAEPRFALRNARIAKADVVGNDHVRCFLAGAGGGRLKGIAFRAADKVLGAAMLQARGGSLHLAGALRRDRWRDRDEVQLVIADGAPAAGG